MDFRDVVCKLINDNSYKKVAEIGIWKGELSRKIIKQCSPEYLLLVDPLSYNMNNFGDYKCTMGEPEKKQEDLDKIAKQIEKLNAHFLRMNSIDAASFIKDGSLDLVFIDAVHLREYVKEDILTWLPKLRKGGMISGDDWIEPKHEKEIRAGVRNSGIGEVSNIGRIWYKKI